jgi:putative transcriptional regulator
LADAVGVNNQTIGYLERGDYKPSLERALKIARHFGWRAGLSLMLCRNPFCGGSGKTGLYPW